MKHMLIKGNDVIGLEVISLSEGKDLGKVKDIVFDPQTQKVKAILLDSGSLFSDAKMILIDDIHSIGKDALTVDTHEVIKKSEEVDKSVADIAKNDQYLTDTKIITENGTDLGKITDILFDPHTGKVTEFEISQGLLRNAQSGKKRVRVDDIITVGKDATIVRAYAEDAVRQQAQDQGIQGSVNQTKQQIPVVLEQAKAKAGELVNITREKAENIKDNPKTQEFVQKVNEDTHQAKEIAQQKLQQAKEFAQHKAHEVGENINQASQSTSDTSGTTGWETVPTLSETESTKATTIQDKGKEIYTASVTKQVITPKPESVRYSGAMGGKSQRKNTKKQK